MMAVPREARFTIVDVAPTEGTLRGMPSSATKFTGNETAAALMFVK
jgi:hypothetical protein